MPSQSLLKSFFSALPEPLFPESTYDALVSIAATLVRPCAAVTSSDHCSCARDTL